MCSESLPTKKACDNRCSSGACKNKKVEQLIIAACGGSIRLLEKRGAELVPHEYNQAALSSPQAFNDFMSNEKCRRFNQVVLVGSGNDLAWVSALLSPELSKCVVAEMTYPLCNDWLHEPSLAQLKATLNPLVQ